jgi:two-component system sensor kinase FixL
LTPEVISALYLQVSCSPVFDDAGRLTGTVHVMRDITEMRRVAELLRKGQAEQLLVRDAAIDSIPIGVMILSATEPGAPIVYVNRAFEEITGYSKDDVLGRAPSFLRGPESAPAAIEQIEASLATGSSLLTELTNYKKDGTPFTGMIRVGSIRGVGGTITHYVMTVSDVTQMRNTEADYELQREELMHMARVGQLGELASSIAHEINQPLTAILSNAQAAQRFLAEEKPNLAEIIEILKDIAEDDKRAGEVIRRLRTLLKKRELQFERIDINELISETIELLRTDAVVRNKVIKLDLDSRVPTVRGDSVQLQQVLLNLITNGLDSMVESGPEARELRIRTAREGADWVVVSVKDSGLGIPENKMKLLFRPYFTTKSDGMGMGLPISRSIIEDHGGQILAENNPGRGATFYFTLPVYDEPPSGARPERG